MHKYDVTVMPTIEERVAEGKRPQLYLYVQVPRPVLTVSAEFLVYDLGDLAGDVGGMCGMTLGVSMVTCYDSALAWLAAVFGGGKKKKGGKRQLRSLVRPADDLISIWCCTS